MNLTALILIHNCYTLLFFLYSFLFRLTTNNLLTTRDIRASIIIYVYLFYIFKCIMFFSL